MGNKRRRDDFLTQIESDPMYTYMCNMRLEAAWWLFIFILYFFANEWGRSSTDLDQSNVIISPDHIYFH